MNGANKGCEPKQSVVFTEAKICIIQALDNMHLLLKTVAICGIFYLCRKWNVESVD